MTNKKKQSAVAVVATVMSITSVLTPVAAVHAADAQTDTRQTQTESEGNTPLITLPQHLTGNAGQPLHSIVLPDGWNWADENTIISKEKTEYLARIIVDDNTYDYSTVEGYNANGHYVEKMISVTVLVSEPNTALPFKAQITSPQVNSINTTGEVDINPTDFPDGKFREYLLSKYGKGGNKIEIADVTTIDVRNKRDIMDLTGIEKFTDLQSLYCDHTGITSLDVSKNINLRTLYCSDTGIQFLDVSKNTILASLDCSNTGIQTLGVSKNTKLEDLICVYTGIQTLDVSKNTKLGYLDCSNTRIQNLDVSKNATLMYLGCDDNPNLTYLNCSNTYITALDVSNNTALTYLDCSDTEIQTLDVSNNTKLEYLDCSNIYITALDVSNNTKLEYLDCFNTYITALDVSNHTAMIYLDCNSTKMQTLNVSKNTALTYLDCNYNPYLTDLDCSNTGIQSLDVRYCTNLKYLDTRSTNLAYIDWGTAELNTWDKSSSTIDLTVTGDTLDITKKIAGIDVRKVTVTQGGRLDGNNITGYKVGTPIQYTYACGNVNGSSETLTITLNLFKSDSKIEITDHSDMTYTGNPISYPSVDLEGSSGDVTYTYEFWKGNTWDIYNGTPTNIGKYRVTAHLAEDDFYNGAKDTKEFTISKATNSWTENLAIADWAYGDKAAIPTAKAKFGDIVYTYSDSEKGIYTDTVPMDAGTWYVKATITGTDNYTGLETIKEFTIEKATPVYTVPMNLTVSYGKLLKDITLPEGLIWTDDTQYAGSVGTRKFKAKYTPEDTNNYVTVQDIDVPVIVTQASNSWTEELAITNWTYGDKVANPTAKAKFGNVAYTYSDSEKGIYTDTVPTDAGTWYVKVTVTGTDNYAGLETIRVFTIAPKNIMNNNQIFISDVKSDKDVENLILKYAGKELKKGIDYDVHRKQDGNRVLITITCKGNYTGVVTRSYTIEKKKSSGDTKKQSDTKRRIKTMLHKQGIIQQLDYGQCLWLYLQECLHL